ncbi:hypothetical protein [Larkinella arboricola]
MKSLNPFVKSIFSAFLLLLSLEARTSGMPAPKPIQVQAEQVKDKIRGGLLGQMLGNLNGIPYEFKYIEEPGNLKNYIPSLPNGAYTDDDTDFEWVYIYTMQKKRTVFLPYDDVTALWKERINRNIWCSNRYARFYFPQPLGRIQCVGSVSVRNIWSAGPGYAANRVENWPALHQSCYR